MSFTGYDSEALGFDSSVFRSRTKEMDSSTQTTEFGETGVGCQAKLLKDCGSNTEVITGEASEYPQPVPGLNEFLRKVVPGVLEQLDKKNASEISVLDVSSESDEEDILAAKLFQELDMKTGSSGAGDHQPENILAVTWSSAGYSLAVSIGRLFHEEWCHHEGLIKVFTVKRSDGDKFAHTLDITEKNCVTAVKYHPSVAALLAYGTTSGEVVLCNLRSNLGSKDFQLSSPPGTHNSVRITSLQWADSPLANIFLIMQIQDKRIRRGASDQVLISAAADGSINVWQVNACNPTFQNIICYSIGGTKVPGPEITCFDFIKIYPLRPSDEKYLDDIFVVGTKTGKLFLCNMKEYNPIPGGSMVDPVYEVMEGHSTCVLDVAFSFQKTNIFASVSMDSEIRVYNVEQNAPIKVLCMDDMLTSIGWAPSSPCLLIAGVAKVGKKGQLLKVYNVSSGREIPMQGLKVADADDGLSITALDVNQSGVCRVAAGDSAGRIHIWDVPIRRVKLTPDDLDF